MFLAASSLSIRHCLQMFTLGPYKKDKVTKPKCLGSVMVFLAIIFLNYDSLVCNSKAEAKLKKILESIKLWL